MSLLRRPRDLVDPPVTGVVEHREGLDSAYLRAERVCTAVFRGVANTAYWREAATQLLARLLQAAELDGQPLGVAAQWIRERTVAPAVAIFRAHDDTRAAWELEDMDGKPAAEQSAIWAMLTLAEIERCPTV
jgi:hypothetical protein